MSRSRTYASKGIDTGDAMVNVSDARSASRGCNPIMEAIAAALPTGGASSESRTPVRKAGSIATVLSATAAANGSAIPTQTSVITIKRDRIDSDGAKPAVRNEPNVSRKAERDSHSRLSSASAGAIKPQHNETTSRIGPRWPSQDNTTPIMIGSSVGIAECSRL
jgi:hypothetical protein